jgi:4-amino-4-deoxy-L-arabinose transferase-like glycosyltransferase
MRKEYNMITENFVPIQAAPQGWLNRPIWKRITPAGLFILAIMLLSFTLHMINIDKIGDANAYYTAAVKAMLQSWHNFFFAAAEPGGSVTVDKPPLGLWIETAFAAVLGLNGFVVSLPNILAGIFGIPVLYHLVKKYLGSLAGLIAGLVFAVTPVVLATDRNNTMDGMLIFTLLLAAWAFIKATDTGRLRWLLLGAVLVGLGFNIKMLQAFLPLPAFYTLFFLGSKLKWNKKVGFLVLATIVLLVVSLSWAVAVDLTPADQRPYVGSSSNNSELNLILGYNGVNRLLGNQAGGPGGDQAMRLPPQDGGPGGNQNGFPPEDGPAINRPELPSGSDVLPGLAGNGQRPGGQNGGTMFGNEVGSASLVRFFVAPLAVQMSWLLPFALISLVVLAFSTRLKLPLENEHRAWVLWGGWLLTCLVFFSMAGFFHAYYMIMLAPALAAVVAAGMKTIWQQREKSWVRWLGLAAVLITVIFQAWLAIQYEQYSWLWLAAGLTLLGGIGWLVYKRISAKTLLPLVYIVLMAGMLVTPLAWSVLTVMDRSPDMNLPSAYRGENSGQGPAQNMTGNTQDDRNQPAMGLGEVQPGLLDYLESHTQDTRYLVAVPSANAGSSLVLATGRPVLYMGGFSGNDPVVDAGSLAELVKNGELRYVLMQGNQAVGSEISTWLKANCSLVPEFSTSTSSSQDPATGNLPRIELPSPGADQVGSGSTLYQCNP